MLPETTCIVVLVVFSGKELWIKLKFQGVDYDETFSPVVMLKSVRIMLAIAAFLIMIMKFGKWMSKLHSLIDIKEELYMIQP